MPMGPLCRSRHRPRAAASRCHGRMARHVPARPAAPSAGCHRSVAHPQLLHHRPHRPRQVDARRPHARHHRRGQRPRHARPVPRPHGHRARTRHHHQEPGGQDAVGGRRGRSEARDLRPQHDRHPRPRGLHVRGVPLARRLRGSDPPGRRGPGDRSPDTRESVPRPRERSRDHPGAQQDRPAGRGPGEVRPRARAADRVRPRRCAAGQRQDRRGRRGAARPGGREDPRPDRRRERADPRDDLRLGVRQLPRRDHLRPHDRRQAAPAREDPDDVDPRHPRAARDRRELARAEPRPRVSASARSAT